MLEVTWQTDWNQWCKEFEMGVRLCSVRIVARIPQDDGAVSYILRRGIEEYGFGTHPMMMEPFAAANLAVKA